MAKDLNKKGMLYVVFPTTTFSSFYCISVQRLNTSNRIVFCFKSSNLPRVFPSPAAQDTSLQPNGTRGLENGWMEIFKLETFDACLEGGGPRR